MDLSTKREEIRVVVKADGTVEYEVRGVKGTSCTEMTKFLDSLGESVLLCHTDEYHEQEVEEHVEIKL